MSEAGVAGVWDQGARSAGPGAFLALAARVRPVVNQQLGALLAERLAAVGRHGEGVQVPLGAASALSVRGGKRLRAALVVAGYEACGGEPEAGGIIAAAVAVELLQAYLLIHDDWLDGDEVRRGGPSVHALLRELYPSRQEADGGAVLAGDFVSALALEALLMASPAPDRLIEAARLFAGMHQEVIVGQLLDLHGSPALAVETMHDLKTGSYSVRGPLLLGAALAGAGVDVRASLAAYAMPLGVAFQMRDDLLGTFGDPDVTGKPVGGDLRRGKRTALAGALAADPVAAPLLARVFGVAGADEAQVQAVVAAGAGARRQVERRIAELLEQARQALAAAPLSARGHAILEEAIQVLGERDR